MEKKQLNQETKIKILLSAKKIFAANGFAGARMDAIAKDTGVNKAMLHYYFGSKENLYQEVIIYLVRLGIKSDCNFNDINMGWSASQKLAVAIYCIVHMHFDALDDDFHRIIAWDFAEGKNSMKMLVRDYFGPGLLKLEQIIVEGIKNGDFESKNPLLSVWSFIIFIITYINQQEIYRDTEMYSRLYGENPREIIIDFLMVHIFKSLSVTTPVVIPEIPPEVKEFFEKQVLEIKTNRNTNI